MMCLLNALMRKIDLMVFRFFMTWFFFEQEKRGGLRKVFKKVILY